VTGGQKKNEYDGEAKSHEIGFVWGKTPGTG